MAESIDVEKSVKSTDVPVFCCRSCLHILAFVQMVLNLVCFYFALTDYKLYGEFNAFLKEGPLNVKLPNRYAEFDWDILFGFFGHREQNACRLVFFANIIISILSFGVIFRLLRCESENPGRSKHYMVIYYTISAILSLISVSVLFGYIQHHDIFFFNRDHMIKAGAVASANAILYVVGGILVLTFIKQESIVMTANGLQLSEVCNK